VMFSPEEREALRAELLARARHDNRISGGAVTGSGSIDALDRWSDVDLAFGVRDRDQLLPTLEDFTQFMRDGPGAIDTVDVRRDPWIYRGLPVAEHPAGRPGHGACDRFRGADTELQAGLRRSTGCAARSTARPARAHRLWLALRAPRPLVDHPPTPMAGALHAQLDAGPSRRACRARGRAPRPRGSGRRSSAGKGQ